MGINSIGDSDNTSDFMCAITDSIKLQMIDRLQEEDNEFNTPGYIDVALVLSSMVSDNNRFHFTYEWYKEIWKPLHDLMKKNRESWKDFDNFEELLKFVAGAEAESLTYEPQHIEHS